MNMPKQKILVTGGAGYIGSVLVPALLEDGHQVTVIDNFMYRQTSLLRCCADPNFRVLKADVRNASVMDTEIPKHDVIVPLAALVGAPACDRDPEAAKSIHVDAIRHLVSRIGSGQRILYPVTNSGYGIGESGKFCTEESPLRPISLYGTTKVEAERILLDAGRAITFRLATVFGTAPRMRIDLLVNDFVYRAVNDRFIVLFEAHFKRNYIHVRDVTGVFRWGLAHFDRMQGQTYNVGLSDANLSKMELCERIREHIPEFHVFHSNMGQDPDKRDYIVSNAKIEATGWKPAYSLDDGIAELIKGYSMIRNAAFFDNLV